MRIASALILSLVFLSFGQLMAEESSVADTGYIREVVSESDFFDETDRATVSTGETLLVKTEPYLLIPTEMVSEKYADTIEKIAAKTAIVYSQGGAEYGRGYLVSRSMFDSFSQLLSRGAMLPDSFLNASVRAGYFLPTDWRNPSAISICDKGEIRCDPSRYTSEGFGSESNPPKRKFDFYDPCAAPLSTDGIIGGAYGDEIDEVSGTVTVRQ
ncbi:MAG: hypothetical protein HQK52_19315 [Oligoflexia bacterium]|nr:hypothetical protein [Oligoflexia bacterium]